MKKIFCCGLASLAIALAADSAQADIIEVKGKGFLNGKIIRQDKKELQFMDRAGNKFVFPQDKILFAEVEAEPTLVDLVKKKLLERTPAPPAAAPPVEKAAELPKPEVQEAETGEIHEPGVMDEEKDFPRRHTSVKTAGDASDMLTVALAQAQAATVSNDQRMQAQMKALQTAGLSEDYGYEEEEKGQSRFRSLSDD